MKGKPPAQKISYIFLIGAFKLNLPSISTRFTSVLLGYLFYCTPSYFVIVELPDSIFFSHDRAFRSERFELQFQLVPQH
jgi:hypothetical protein